MIGLTTNLYMVIYEVRTFDSTNKTISFKLNLYLTHKRLEKSEIDSKLGYYKTLLDIDTPLANIQKQCHID